MNRSKLFSGNNPEEDLLEQPIPGRSWANNPPSRGWNSGKPANIRTTSSDFGGANRLPPFPDYPNFYPQPAPWFTQASDTNGKAEQNEDELEEIPFIMKVHVNQRNSVKLILSLDVPKKEKLDRLEKILVMATFRECERWLEEKENTTDFVQFLPEDCKALAKDWEIDQACVVLDALLEKKGNDKAKEAYKRWKTKHGLDIQKQESSKEPKKEDEKEDKEFPSITKKLEPEESKVGPDNEPVKEERKKKPKNRKKENKPAKNENDQAQDAKTQPNRQEPKSDEDGYDTAKEEEDAGIFNDKMANETTIVILGGSGNGKTTFINTIANLLVQRNLSEACKKPLILIHTQFHFIGKDKVPRLVDTPVTFDVEREKKTTEEFSETGQSVTQFARSYTFKVGNTGKIVRIVDTPGVNDTRGVGQDTQNFTQIVNFISSFKKIHAFIFMLKSNETRLGIGFTYSLNQLLVHLHKSAAENIIFCLSHGRATNFRPGETYTLLQKYLNNIYGQRKIRIGLEGRVFVFDCDVYRYLCASRLYEYEQKEIRQFEASWVHGKDELKAMFELVVTLKPHDVINTLSVNKVRRAIELMARPLAEIAKNQLQNIQLIEEKQREIKERIANGEDLHNQLYAEEIHMETEDLEHPVTVCTHKNCVERQKLHPYGAEEIVYSQECHKECYLQNLIPGELPNENIKECEIFSDIGNENVCTICKHGYEHHMHLKYRLTRRVERIVDKRIEDALNSNTDKITIAQQFIAEREQQRRAYQEDLEQKQASCAHFAVFLRHHGMLHYNDQYLAYLNKHIQEIEQGLDFGGDPATLNRLKDARDQYEELVKIFEKTASTEGAVKSVEEIEVMLNELEISRDGQLVANIRAIEQFADDTASVPYSPVVEVGQKKKDKKEKSSWPSWTAIKDTAVEQVRKRTGFKRDPTKPSTSQDYS